MDLEMRAISDRAECAGDGSRILETEVGIEDDVVADSNAPARNKAVRVDEAEQRSSCVIDINGHDFVGENQRVVCRICHLSEKESGKTPIELMEIGCGCQGELGVAHSHCAETWFRVRGNRVCEICGEIAKNITGVDDAGFMEEWNESATAAGADTFTSSSDGSRRCLRGQPMCNSIMACLVIAFVLLWFFRVNMF
ncbi:hypothetical protein OROMI_023735 [Orobanche minor]